MLRKLCFAVGLTALGVSGQNVPDGTWHGTVDESISGLCVQSEVEVVISSQGTDRTVQITKNGIRGPVMPFMGNENSTCYSVNGTEYWASELIGPRAANAPTAAGRPTAVPPSVVGAPTVVKPTTASAPTVVKPTTASAPTVVKPTTASAPTAAPQPTPLRSGGVNVWRFTARPKGNVVTIVGCNTNVVPCSPGHSLYVLTKREPADYMNQYNDVDGGQWIACYTSNGEVNLNQHFRTMTRGTFGQDGYVHDCSHIRFSDVMFVNHDTNEKNWFTRIGGGSTSFYDLSYNGAGEALFQGNGPNIALSYRFQMNVCGGNAGGAALMMSGFNSTCLKTCTDWCDDFTTQYFRHSGTGASGVAFRIPGLRSVSYRPTVSVLIRRPQQPVLISQPCQDALEAMSFDKLKKAVTPDNNNDCQSAGGLNAADSESALNFEQLVTNSRIEKVCRSTCLRLMTDAFKTVQNSCRNTAERAAAVQSQNFMRAARFQSIYCLSNKPNLPAQPTLEWLESLLYKDYQNITGSNTNRMENLRTEFAAPNIDPVLLKQRLDMVCDPGTRTLAERIGLLNSSLAIAAITPGGLGTICAKENEICTCTGKVTYGANGRFVSKVNNNLSISCSNKEFTDPIEGVVKACYCLKSQAERDQHLLGMLCDKHPAHGGNYTSTNFFHDLPNIVRPGSKIPQGALLCRPGYGRLIDGITSTRPYSKVQNLKKFHSLLCDTGPDGGPGRCQRFISTTLIWQCDLQPDGPCSSNCRQSIRDLQSTIVDRCCWTGALQFMTGLMGEALLAWDRWATSKCGTIPLVNDQCKGSRTAGFTLGSVDPNSIAASLLPNFKEAVARDVSVRLNLQLDEMKIDRFFFTENTNQLEVEYTIFPRSMELVDVWGLTTSAIVPGIPGFENSASVLNFIAVSDWNTKPYDSKAATLTIDKNTLTQRTLAPTLLPPAPTSIYDPNTGQTIPPTPSNTAASLSSSAVTFVVVTVAAAALLY